MNALRSLLFIALFLFLLPGCSSSKFQWIGDNATSYGQRAHDKRFKEVKRRPINRSTRLKHYYR